MSIYENSYNTIYDSLSQEDDSRELFNSMFGFVNDTRKITTTEPNFFDTPSDKTRERMSNFYLNWNSADETINAYRRVLLNYGNETDNVEDVPVRYTNINNVVNFFLNMFFSNFIFLQDLTRTSIFPEFSQENSPTYTPVLEKLYYFLRSETVGGVNSLGYVGQETLTYRCVNNFKNYVKKNYPSINLVLEDENSINPWENLYKNNGSNKNFRKAVFQYRKEVASNNTLLKWCGCYTPPTDQLQKAITGKAQQDVYNYTICDPFCINEKSIYRFSTYSSTINTGLVLKCESTVCIMSDVDIDISESSTMVNFIQICPGCDSPDKNCICVVDTNSTDFLNKIDFNGRSLANQFTFNQLCPSSVCYKYDENGNYIERECDSEYTYLTDDIENFRGTGKTLKEFYQQPPKFLYFIVSVFIIYIIIYLFYLIIEMVKNLKKFKTTY